MTDPWPIGHLRPDWVPDEVDWHKPSPARVYDVHLGGAHNFAVDRAVAREVAAVMPELPMLLRANRSFLRRAVQHLVRQGITQFLDLGSGIPTVGNVHDAAQGIDPACRVVYVDVDPIAVAHSRRLLAGNRNAVAIGGDLCDSATILAQLGDVLDFSEPIAVLMVAVLHFVADEARPDRIVREYMNSTVPGSYLVLSHGTRPDVTDDSVEAATELYSQAVEQFHLRTAAEITRLFGDLELVEPGVVPVALWRPDDEAESRACAHLPQMGGVAQLR